MSTMCIDIRRVDDDYVCIYKAAHDYFQLPTHLAQSSWCDVDKDDITDKYRFNYFIVAKDEDYENIEIIIYSSCDKYHTYEVLNDINTKGRDALFYYEKLHDYRIIRVPIYKLIPFRVRLSSGKLYRGHRQKINKLSDEFKLYCPKDLNKKYRVYGTYGERKKNNKGCHWRCPKLLKGNK